MTVIFRHAPHGIQILSDRSKTEIRDARVAFVIYKYIRLDTRQHGRGIGLMRFTYPFQVTMNYVAGVEKVKPFCDIRQLAAGLVRGQGSRKGVYKTEPVYSGLFFDIFRQVSAGHPL